MYTPRARRGLLARALMLVALLGMLALADGGRERVRLRPVGPQDPMAWPDESSTRVTANVTKRRDRDPKDDPTANPPRGPRERTKLTAPGADAKPTGR